MAGVRYKKVAYHISSISLLLNHFIMTSQRILSAGLLLAGIANAAVLMNNALAATPQVCMNVATRASTDLQIDGLGQLERIWLRC